jgi:uncharacterized membrane protein
MIDFGLARALHVVAVVIWIGGVAMVTTVLLPGVRRSHTPEERFTAFHAIESRFATQARWTTALAGLSGFYMVWRIDAWDRFASPSFWWMHAMLLTWLVFTIMLFVAEPLFLHRFLEHRAAREPDKTYRLIERLHWVLLGLSLITVAGAAAGVAGVNLLGL